MNGQTNLFSDVILAPVYQTTRRLVTEYSYLTYEPHLYGSVYAAFLLTVF
jgi:hypothetical protein